MNDHDIIAQRRRMGVPGPDQRRGLDAKRIRGTAPKAAAHGDGSASEDGDGLKEGYQVAKILALKPKEKDPLRCHGVGRDDENPKGLVACFSRPVTDDELRYLCEVLQRAAACNPIK